MGVRRRALIQYIPILSFTAPIRGDLGCMHRFCFVFDFLCLEASDFGIPEALGMANKGKLICWKERDLVDGAAPYGAQKSMHVIQPNCHSIINRFSFA